MSLDEFECQLDQVKLARPLVSSEIVFIKNARRALRNKIYARESRTKRKETLLYLEDTVFELHERIEAMQEEMRRLIAENMILKTEKAKQPAIPEPPQPLFYDVPSDMIWQDESLSMMPLDPLYHNMELITTITNMT